MPAITLLGWFHTICGILSILIVLYVLFRHKLISFQQKSLQTLFSFNIHNSLFLFTYIQSRWFWYCSYIRSFNIIGCSYWNIS